MSISVDLKALIDEIRVAPQASHWYSELVEKMVSRYGIGVVPQQSEIDAKPLY